MDCVMIQPILKRSAVRKRIQVSTLVVIHNDAPIYHQYGRYHLYHIHMHNTISYCLLIILEGIELVL